MPTLLQVPSVETLNQFFGCEPSYSDLENLYWEYSMTDSRNISLSFGYDVINASVRITLSIAGKDLTTIVQEGAVALSIAEGEVKVTFDRAGLIELVAIRVEPFVSVHLTALVA
jgi:hypothetical protein